MRPQRPRCPLVRRFTIVRLDKPAADEEDIPRFDVAALRRRADIDALVFAALVQLFERDRVVVVRVVLDALAVRVAAVVEQDAAAGDAVLGPVVDGALGVGGGADDVGAVCVVVEGAGRKVGELGLLVGVTRDEYRGGYVSEAVPLGPALGVEVVDVVVGEVLGQGLDLVHEGFATESWDGRGVQG